jgi:hypothetical protein
MALEDTDICAIPYAHLTDLAASVTGMQHVISRLMSREILREHSLMMLLGSMNADERLAAFLLNLSQRYAARGYSEREFHLRMSRAEIGSYCMKLGRSAASTAFQQQRLLEVTTPRPSSTWPERRFGVRSSAGKGAVMKYWTTAALVSPRCRRRPDQEGHRKLAPAPPTSETVSTAPGSGDR